MSIWGSITRIIRQQCPDLRYKQDSLVPAVVRNRIAPCNSRSLATLATLALSFLVRIDFSGAANFVTMATNQILTYAYELLNSKSLLPAVGASGVPSVSKAASFWFGSNSWEERLQTKS
jgi:hypothetical protein